MPQKIQKQNNSGTKIVKKTLASPFESASKKVKFRWSRLLKWIAIPVLTATIVSFAAAAVLFISYASAAPKLNINMLESQPNTTIMDSNGKVIASLGAEQRVLVSTDQIPMQMVNAVTSIEDHNFFYEKGIDPTRIISSLIHNSSSGTTQGGSTLTQQLIKLSFFSTAASDRTLKVKAQEAWMAIQLEKEMSKEQILTLYINKVYMSNGYYGMQTASESFFQKPLSQLTLAQTALLAGMPQAPNTYNPYTNPTSAKYRRDLVLEAMYKYGKISKAQENEAIATSVTEGLKSLPTTSSIPAYVDDYVTQVVQQVEQDTGKNPITTSMKIYTPLNSGAQQRLFNIVNTNEYVPFDDDQQQVATTLVNVKTGGVVAQIGGRKQPAIAFGLNQAVQTDRDWGSSMKPITDYGPAFQNGIYKSSSDTVVDGPYDYPGTSTSVSDWDNLYYGNMTVRTALDLSRNIPAVKTLAAVGLPDASAFLNNLGIKYPQMEYSNAISSNTSQSGNQWGASSEKMAAAYAAFANGGYYTPPYYVDKVVYADGTSTNLKAKSKEAMSAATAYMVTDILKGVLNGQDDPVRALSTGLTAQIPGLPSAGKTGTSNYTDTEYQQAWANAGYPNLQGGSMSPDELFVGYTTQYSMAVWTGYSNRMIPIYGTVKMYVPTRVWKAMFEYLYPKPSTAADWSMPSGMSGTPGSVLYMPGTTGPSYYSTYQSQSIYSSSPTPNSGSDSNSSQGPVPNPSSSSSASSSSAPASSSSSAPASSSSQ